MIMKDGKKWNQKKNQYLIGSTSMNFKEWLSNEENTILEFTPEKDKGE